MTFEPQDQHWPGFAVAARLVADRQNRAGGAIQERLDRSPAKPPLPPQRPPKKTSFGQKCGSTRYPAASSLMGLTTG